MAQIAGGARGERRINRQLSSEEALSLLLRGQPIEDTTITGELRFSDLPDHAVTVPLVLHRCHVESLLGTFTAFRAPVIVEHCTFQQTDFYAAYFLAGASFMDCQFPRGADFQCGGHNEPPACFRLEGCIFGDFVNFFDNWFPGPVEIRSCHFEQGTNLLGNVGQPFEVMFEIPPIIEGNSGRLAKDGG